MWEPLDYFYLSFNFFLNRVNTSTQREKVVNAYTTYIGMGHKPNHPICIEDLKYVIINKHLTVIDR